MALVVSTDLRIDGILTIKIASVKTKKANNEERINPEVVAFKSHGSLPFYYKVQWGI